MKLSVHLVTWNGAKYVPYLFDSLRQQTFSAQGGSALGGKDWELLIIDNASTDNTVNTIQKELVNFPVPSRIITNNNNTGFAGGHNQAFRETKGEYVLLLNQDMYLQPDCLEKMAHFLDERKAVAAVSPRLMRWDFKSLPAVNLEKSFSDFVDSLGLKIFRSRRVIEQHTQEKWVDIKESFNSAGAVKVFGVSGAFPMFRRSALQEVLYADGTIFDESYFLYKEDVDVAFRLAQRGHEAYVLLGTAAYHDRTGAGPRSLSDAAAASNKKMHNGTVRYHSYKNHLRTIYKNEYWQNFLLDFPWIIWYELKKFIYFLLFDPKVLTGLKEVWQERTDLKNKRTQIKKIKRVTWQQIRKWWL